MGNHHRDPLLCAAWHSTLALDNVEEEYERELMELEENKEVCLTPPRVMSPFSDSSSFGSPQPSSPVSFDFPHEIQRMFEDMPLSTYEFKNADLMGCEVEDYIQQPEPRSKSPELSVFSPWMCVFDLDAACGSDSSSSSDGYDVDRCGSLSPSSITKHPLHIDPPSSKINEHWLDDLHHGMLMPVMNQFFACLDPEYARVMTIDEESCITNEKYPPPFPSPCNNRSLLTPIPTTDPHHWQYFTNFASDRDIEAIYVVCWSTS